MDWVQDKLHVGGRDTTCRLTMHIIHENACVFELTKSNTERMLTFSHTTKPNLRRSGWCFQGTITSLPEYGKIVASCSWPWCSEALVTIGGVG